VLNPPSWPGPVPAIHVFGTDVDARAKPAHDGA
jgi:hypothetical protein